MPYGRYRGDSAAEVNVPRNAPDGEYRWIAEGLGSQTSPGAVRQPTLISNSPLLATSSESGKLSRPGCCEPGVKQRDARAAAIRDQHGAPTRVGMVCHHCIPIFRLFPLESPMSVELRSSRAEVYMVRKLSEAGRKPGIDAGRAVAVGSTVGVPCSPGATRNFGAEHFSSFTSLRGALRCRQALSSRLDWLQLSQPLPRKCGGLPCTERLHPPPSHPDSRQH